MYREVAFGREKSYAVKRTVFALAFIFIWATTIISCLVKKKSADDYFEYGKHYASEGDFIQAQRFFTKAIKSNRLHYDAYLQRALAWQQTDSLTNAIKDYDSLLTFPNLTVTKTADLYFMRANVKYLNLQDTLSCQDWRKSCDLNHNKACDYARKRCK